MFIGVVDLVTTCGDAVPVARTFGHVAVAVAVAVVVVCAGLQGSAAAFTKKDGRRK